MSYLYDGVLPIKIIIFFSYPDAKIPTLFEAIDVIKEEDMYMLLEIKDYNSQVGTLVQCMSHSPLTLTLSHSP